MNSFSEVKLRLLTLILTSDCNLHCSYCFQKRETVSMDDEIAKRAIDYFLDHSGEKVQIIFYGGEPLLTFSVMQRIMAYSTKIAWGMSKKISYGLTTNGTLCNDDVFDFLSRFEGRLNLSLDGPPEVHTAGRGPQSWPDIQPIQEFSRKNPQWKLWINTVVTPCNVTDLFRSLRFLYTLNLGRIHLSYQYEGNWREEQYQTFSHECDKLARWFIRTYRSRGEIVLDALKRTIPGKQPFTCTAGRDQFAVAPDGSVYGCFSLAPLAQKAAGSKVKLRLGGLDDLRGARQKVLGNGAGAFRQSDYHTATKSCRTCDGLLLCTVCPGVGLLAYGDPFTIPESICHLSRIRRRVVDRIFYALTQKERGALWNIVQ